MKLMCVMRKSDFVVFHSDPGVLRSMRKRLPAFKGARIKEVLQALPSSVELGVIYEAEKWPPEEQAR